VIPVSDDALASSNSSPSLKFPAPLLQLRTQTRNDRLVFVNIVRLLLRQICHSIFPLLFLVSHFVRLLCRMTLATRSVFSGGLVRPFFLIVSSIFDHACMSFHYNVLFKIKVYERHPIEKKS
jgi:hypothetical protein